MCFDEYIVSILEQEILGGKKHHHQTNKKSPIPRVKKHTNLRYNDSWLEDIQEN